MSENEQLQDENTVQGSKVGKSEKELTGKPKSNLGSEEEQATEVAAGGIAESNNDAIKGNKGGMGDGPVTQNGS